jgi:hypothetical protein
VELTAMQTRPAVLLEWTDDCAPGRADELADRTCRLTLDMPTRPAVLLEWTDDCAPGRADELADRTCRLTLDRSRSAGAAFGEIVIG